VRERFWIGENRRCEALVQLSRAEGIEEVIVMATCNRTEFWLWAPDVTLAANSVMRLLGAEYGLKLCEWKHFYRLLDEAALLHIFRVASSLDSMVVGEPQVVSQVKEAGKQAQKVGATGRFLDACCRRRSPSLSACAVKRPSATRQFRFLTPPWNSHAKFSARWKTRKCSC